MPSAAGGGHRSTQTTMNSNLAASDVRGEEEGRGHRCRPHPHRHPRRRYHHQ